MNQRGHGKLLGICSSTGRKITEKGTQDFQGKTASGRREPQGKSGKREKKNLDTRLGGGEFGKPRGEKSDGGNTGWRGKFWRVELKSKIVVVPFPQ